MCSDIPTSGVINLSDAQLRGDLINVGPTGPKYTKKCWKLLSDGKNSQQEMFVKERVDGVLDNARWLLLRWVINGNSAVRVTTTSCKHRQWHHLLTYLITDNNSDNSSFTYLAAYVLSYGMV